MLKDYHKSKQEASEENSDKALSFDDEYRRRWVVCPGQVTNGRKVWTKAGKINVEVLKKGNKKIKGTGSIYDVKATAMPLRGVYVNFDLIEDVLRTLATEPSRNSIKDFLMTLCENVNSCFGNQWDPVIVDNPNTPGIEMKDMNVMNSNLSAFGRGGEGKWETVSADADSPSTYDEEAEKQMYSNEYTNAHIDMSGSDLQFAYDFGALTKFSLVRNVTMTSKIPTGLQAMMFIGATSALKDDDDKAGATSGGAFSVQSARIQDRLYASETVKSTDTDNPTLTADETFMISMWNAYGEYTTDAFEIAKDGLDNLVEKSAQLFVGGGYLQASQQMNIQAEGEDSEAATEEDEYSPLLPFNVGFTTDGISGIYMGNAFSMRAALPRRHSRAALFMVTKVGHTIQGGDWETTVDGMMRLSKQAGK